MKTNHHRFNSYFERRNLGTHVGSDGPAVVECLGFCGLKGKK